MLELSPPTPGNLSGGKTFMWASLHFTRVWGIKLSLFSFTMRSLQMEKVQQLDLRHSNLQNFEK